MGSQGRRLAAVASLDSRAQHIVESLVDVLRGFPEVSAVVLGGSHARGRALPDSDIDLGVFYRDAAPLPTDALRERVSAIPQAEVQTLTELYEWGPWVNGGAWLSVEGRKVDLLYRSVEHVHRVIDDAERGEFELHFAQQPPFGFFGPTYLGEVQIALPIHDPGQVLDELKERVVDYPEALREAIVHRFLGSAEFALDAFASKYAARGEVYLTVSTLARCVHALTLVLFALNRTHLVNDKTALEEANGFAIAPSGYRDRCGALLSAVGSDAQSLLRSFEAAKSLLDEVRVLALANRNRA